MVKRTITITTILLVLSIVVCLIIALNRASFAADDDIASGTSGTCSWVIDKDGVLTISPTDGVSGTLENTKSDDSNSAKWYQYRYSITKVLVNPGVKANTIASYLFYDFRNCTEMDLTSLDTSNTTNMRRMFYSCSSLTNLNITSFNTSNVTDMSGMFSACKSIATIDVSGFDTSEVTNMNSMFSACESLVNLDVTGFNTSQVTDMSDMFNGCRSLTNLDVTSFDTSNVIYMTRMFISCKNIKTIDLTGFNTSNVTKMNNMFNGCDSLTSIDVAGFDTSKVTNMENMFSGCSSLTNLDVTNFDTSNVTDMSSMFTACRSVATIDVSGFDTSNVTNMSYMFSYCNALTLIDVTGFDTSKVTDMSLLFMDCNHLRTIDVTGFDTSNVVNMNSLFRECSSLTTLNLTGFDTSNVDSMERMFANCNKLSNIVLGENFDFSGNNISPISYQAVLPTPPATITTGKWIRDDKEYGPYTSDELRDNYTSNMAGTWVWEPADKPFAIFDETTKTLNFVRAKELHDNGTIGNVHSISGSDYSGKIFVVNETSTSINRTWASVAAQVKKIQFIDEIKPRSVEEWFFNFTECEEIDVTKLNTENTISLRRLFRDCQKITSLDLSNFNTSNVTSMMQLFNHCYLLENVNVSSFDTSKVTNMDGMFSICRNLSSLDVTNFRTENVTDMAYMFQDLKCINELDLSTFDTSKVTRMTKMFDKSTNMSKIILGSNFSFKGKDISTVSDQSILPLPLEESPYTDRWIREDGAYGPYTPEELRENYDGSTMAGTWIRERKRLTVTYNYTGTIPQGASSLPETRTYLAGEEVTVASDATAPGYTFSGWSRTGTFTMPIENLEITGSFTANTDTPYKVEHYLEDLTEGTYTLTKTDNLTGTTDTEVEATAKEYEGFTFDNTIEGTKQSGTIAGDGSLVLKLYYKRNSYNVTYAYTGEIPNDASSLPQSQNFKYGAEIIVPEEAKAEGYTFSGWIKDYITMPAKDIEITGYFIEKPKSYNYKIEYYFDGELDSSLEEILNAEEEMEISLYPQSSIKHKGTFYTLVSENHKITIGTNEEENVIKVYYETDVLDYAMDNPEDTKQGDGIPDKYQIQIFYKVENGSWDDGTKGTKTNIVTLRDKDGKYAEDGTGKLTIPQVGNKPAEGYSKGSWNAEIPEVVSNKDNGKEYIYSYAKVGSISKIKGSLSNPKTDDIVQSYALYGAIAILLMLVVKRTLNKYSRKKKKIQF